MNKKKVFRKCIVTNKIINIDEMIRFVKDNNNNIFLDNQKKIMGRGAYITKEFSLIIHAIERKLLNKTFKTNISIDVYDRLKQEVKIYEEIKN